MFSIINAALWVMLDQSRPKLRNKELDLCGEEHAKDESSDQRKRTDYY
jgi:hypothetical protein